MGSGRYECPGKSIAVTGNSDSGYDPSGFAGRIVTTVRAPAFVLAVQPQVVVVNNGPTKGWQNSAWDTVAKISGLEDVWQLHRAMGPNHDHNVNPEQIANLEPTEECKGRGLMASVNSDGKFTLTNERTGFTKAYTAR